LALFHLIGTKKMEIGDCSAIQLDYAYAVNPAQRPDDPAATDIPQVIRSSSLVVKIQRRLVRVQVEQSYAQHKRNPQLAEKIFASVKVSR
jgi:hypothetical protein